MACTTSALGVTCAQQDPLAYPGRAVFLTAPYPTQAADRAWPTPARQPADSPSNFLLSSFCRLRGLVP